MDWKQLVRLDDNELARLDIAVVSLGCFADLPSTTPINVGPILYHLDRYASVVKRYTKLGLEKEFAVNPARYENCEPLYRLVCLVNALQRHCGVRYDPARKGLPPDAPFEVEDVSIHAIVFGNGGTCSSLPVLYAAVGRRLGYPLKLVSNYRHQFNRWDDPKTGFKLNLEGSSDGLEFYPDEHYRQWPVPLDLKRERAMSPREELASFLGSRGACHQSAGRRREAIEAYLLAAKVSGRNERYGWCVEKMLDEWEAELRSHYPPQFPVLQVFLPPGDHRLPNTYWEVGQRIKILDATERCLTNSNHEEWWWKPLREGRPPLREVPGRIRINVPAET